MKYKKYNSIKNIYDELYIEKIKNLKSSQSVSWVVTEKIHGSNFAFITNGKNVVCQTRKHILKENEKFYNWQLVRDENKQNILNMFNLISDRFSDPLDEVYVFGELFGGHYQHKDVIQSNTSIRLQKGISYHPENKFMAFDIFIRLKNLKTRWLNYKEFIIITLSSNIMTVPALFMGTLEECLDYPNAIHTKVPLYFNLPEIEDNIAEGIVIKPYFPIFLGKSRIILKNKNNKFKEKVKKKKNKIIQNEFSEIQLKYINEYNLYLSKERFINAASKIGEPDFEKFSQFSKEIFLDALKDFLEDNQSNIILEIPNKNERKRVMKQLKKLVDYFVRDYIMGKI